MLAHATKCKQVVTIMILLLLLELELLLVLELELLLVLELVLLLVLELVLELLYPLTGIYIIAPPKPPLT